MALADSQKHKMEELERKIEHRRKQKELNRIYTE